MIRTEFMSKDRKSGKKRIDSEVNFLAKYTKIAKIYFDAILIT